MKKIVGLLKKLLIVFVALVAISAVFGGGSNGKKGEQSPASTSQEQTGESVSEASEAPQPAVEEPAPIEYQSVTVDDLIAVLDNNPMNAKNTYEGTYIRLTGFLSNIDASGKYFSLNNGDEWSFDSIQCYINDDATLNRIASANMNEQLTVCGKVKSVGEILGYSMDVDYIE